jgi:hypothetical protein
MKRKHEDNDEEKKAQLFLKIPSDVRLKVIDFIDDWDVVAKMCNVNKEVSKWCRDKNIWEQLLRKRFTRDVLYDEEMHRINYDEDYNEYSTAKMIHDNLLIPQFPYWAENKRAYAAAYALAEHLYQNIETKYQITNKDVEAIGDVLAIEQRAKEMEKTLDMEKKNIPEIYTDILNSSSSILTQSTKDHWRTRYSNQYLYDYFLIDHPEWNDTKMYVSIKQNIHWVRWSKELIIGLQVNMLVDDYFKIKSPSFSEKYYDRFEIQCFEMSVQEIIEFLYKLWLKGYRWNTPKPVIFNGDDNCKKGNIRHFKVDA